MILMASIICVFVRTFLRFSASLCKLFKISFVFSPFLCFSLIKDRSQFFIIILVNLSRIISL